MAHWSRGGERSSFGKTSTKAEEVTGGGAVEKDQGDEQRFLLAFPAHAKTCRAKRFYG